MSCLSPYAAHAVLYAVGVCIALDVRRGVADMQNAHGGLIRGLSIASAIVSLICALFLGLVLALFSFGGTIMSDPEVRDQATYSMEFDPAEVRELEALGIPASDPAAMTDWGLRLASALLGILTVGHVAVLIASIVGIVNARRPEKMGMLLVWGIVGAVASLFGCNPVLLVLMIIVTVFAACDRKAAPVGAHMA